MILRVLACLLLAGCGVGAAGCSGSEPPRPDLLLVSSRDGDYAIYALNADGGRQTRLTENGDGDDGEGSAEWLFFQVEPAWSPDGRLIAFSSRRAGSFDIYAMDGDGTGTRRLTSAKGDDTHPTWSPDGGRIAFARDESDIYVMNADGSGVRKITGISGSESQPAWSPDGRWLAYVLRPPGTALREIWLMRPDGSEPTKLTSLRARSIDPAWSPDGRRIAFVSNRASQYYDLYVATVGEKGVRRLTRTGYDAFEPSWSPDGSRIAFSRDGAIVVIDLEGNEETVTRSGNNDSNPVWNPIPPPAED